MNPHTAQMAPQEANYESIKRKQQSAWTSGHYSLCGAMGQSDMSGVEAMR